MSGHGRQGGHGHGHGHGPRDWTRFISMGYMCTLVSNTLLVTEGKDRLPVHKLTFSTPPGVDFDYNLSLGHTSKVCSGLAKPKSYSPFDVKDGGREFSLGVKRYPGGVVSNFLTDLKVGDQMSCFKNDKGKVRNAGAYVGIVAYGIGITEALPVAEAELNQTEAKKVVILWANRTLADAFWHERVAALTAEHKDRFELVHLLSREAKTDLHAPTTLYGRINQQVVQTAFLDRFGVADEPSRKADTRFLSVGTKEMMRMTDDLLGGMGCPMPQHHLLPTPGKDY